MVKQKSQNSSAGLEIETVDGKAYFRFSGSLTADAAVPVLDQAHRYLSDGPAEEIRLDADAIDFCDTAGAALLAHIQQIAAEHNCRVEIILNAEYRPLLEKAQAASLPKPPSGPSKRPLNQLGRISVELAQDFRAQIDFIGHLAEALIYLLFHPREIRFKDLLRTVSLAGADATVIVVLLGLLFGLILAFSSAMPMRQFGAEIFVADLVAYATVRVLGPFVTAVILAGRTGSSIAAELGTMKINNEIDALEVLALDPVRFLVVPRLLAVILAAPLLTILMNLSGLIGAGVVILSMGYPFATYWNHIQSITGAPDIMVGLVKALVFGAIVGAVGAMRGLQTGLGPGAVGISTTRAVVTIIIDLVIAEGIFSVLLYLLDI